MPNPVVLPEWAEYVRALGAPIVAIAAAIIAGFIAKGQLRTAQHKLALDLFDKRLQFYREAADAYNELMKIPLIDRNFSNLYKQLNRFKAVRFLFDKDIERYFEQVEFNFIKLNSIGMELFAVTNFEEFDDREVKGDVDEIKERGRLILVESGEFRAKLEQLLDPYMRMTHKLP